MQDQESQESKFGLLKSEIIDKGYDPSKFESYCEPIKQDGCSDIDAWTYTELKNTIIAF